MIFAYCFILFVSMMLRMHMYVTFYLSELLIYHRYSLFTTIYAMMEFQ